MIIEKRLEKLNKIRKQGYVAGVLFGREFGTNSVAIMAKPEVFNEAYAKYGKFKTFKIKLDGASHEVYIKDIERSVLKPSLIVHFSLLKVAKGDKVTARLPINIAGQAELEKQGMIVIQSLHDIEVEFPIGADVAHLDATVEGLKAGDSVHVSNIRLPEGFKVFLHAEDVVATVAYPKVHEETKQEEATEEKPTEEK